ncbi:MAG: hypothetical protein AB4911_15405 [Oscillochloridaceae bacterium umkhey_bin13]
MSIDEDISNISFGYPIAPMIFDNVWQDYDGNGLRALTDMGIQTVTVVTQARMWVQNLASLA